MIQRFMYVEDGSVDVDTIEEELAEDTKIITYRQGSTPPIIKELEVPARSFLDGDLHSLREENREVRKIMERIAKIANVVKNTPKEIKEAVRAYFNKFVD